MDLAASKGSNGSAIYTPCRTNGQAAFRGNKRHLGTDCPPTGLPRCSRAGVVIVSVRQIQGVPRGVAFPRLSSKGGARPKGGFVLLIGMPNQAGMLSFLPRANWVNRQPNSTVWGDYRNWVCLICQPRTFFQSGRAEPEKRAILKI